MLPQNDVHTEFIRKKSRYETRSWLGLARPQEADLDGVGICEVPAVVPNKVASSHLPAPQLLRVLKLYYKVASSQLPAPQIAPRTKVVLETRQFSASSSTATPRTKVVLQSRQFSASSSTDCSAY